MKIFLIILIAFAAVFGLILFTKIKVRFSLSHINGIDDMRFRIFVLNEKIGFDVFGDEKKKSKKENENKDEKSAENNKENEKNEGFFEKLEKLKEKATKYKYTYLSCREFAKKRFFVEKLDLHVDFGLSDAAKTGIATGAVWAVIYNVFAFITRCAVVKNHRFFVNGDYSNEKFDIKTDMIVSFRPIGVINVMVYIFLKYNFISKKYDEKTEEVY